MSITLISLLVGIFSGTIVYLYFESSVRTVFNRRIGERLTATTAELARTGCLITPESLTTLTAQPLRPASSGKWNLTYFGTDGRLIASSDPDTAPPPPDRFLAPGTLYQIDSAGLDPSGDRICILYCGSACTDQPGVLAAITTDRSSGPMILLCGRVVLALVVCGVVSTAVAAWFVSGLAIRPLQTISRWAGELAPDRESLGPPAPSLAPPATPLALAPELDQLRVELDAAKQRIRIALQANERFITNVSHELKTPVATVLTEAQTLQQKDLPEEARGFVRSVIDEMRRLGRMVESFLLLATTRSGQRLEDARAVNLHDVVLESIAHCGAMARQHDVTMSPVLDDGAQEPGVYGNGELLRVMLDNLVRNSLRFSPRGGDVAIEVATQPPNAILRVRDRGPGIPPELFGKLFERFSQATTEVGRGRGHGLGLSIAQGIAELHGGTISVVNAEGGGCEFTVQLPLLAVSHDQPRETSPSMSVAGP